MGYYGILKFYKIYSFKLCPGCGCEFDYHYFYGECPDWGDDPPPQPGFVFFPELQLETFPFALFPELAFYP